MVPLGWLLLLATATGRRLVPALLLHCGSPGSCPSSAQTLQVAGPVDDPRASSSGALQVPDGARPSSRSSSSRGRRLDGDGCRGSRGPDAPDGIYSGTEHHHHNLHERGRSGDLTLSSSSPRDVLMKVARSENSSSSRAADYGEFALTLYDSTGRTYRRPF